MPVTTTKWFCLVRSPVDLFGVTVRLAIWHLGSTGAGWRGNGVVNHGQGEHGATQDNGEYWYSGQCGSFPDGLRRGSFDSWPGQAPTPKAVAALRWPTSAPIRTCEPVRSGSRGQCACAHTVWHQFGGVLAPEGSPAQRHAEESHRSGRRVWWMDWAPLQACAMGSVDARRPGVAFLEKRDSFGGPGS